MNLAWNLTLAIGGAIAEGAVCWWFIRRLSRPVRRPPRPPALTGEVIGRRPELSAPPRKELTR